MLEEEEEKKNQEGGETGVPFRYMGGGLCYGGEGEQKTEEESGKTGVCCGSMGEGFWYGGEQKQKKEEESGRAGVTSRSMGGGLWYGREQEESDMPGHPSCAGTIEGGWLVDKGTHAVGAVEGQAFATSAPFIELDVFESGLALSVAREGHMENTVALQQDIGGLHEELQGLSLSGKSLDIEQGLNCTTTGGDSHMRTGHQGHPHRDIRDSRHESDMYNANSTEDRTANVEVERGEEEVSVLRQTVERLKEQNRELESQVQCEALNAAVQVVDLEARNRLLQEMLDRLLHGTKEETTMEWIQHLAASVY